MDSTELSRYVGFADAEIGALARVYLDEVSTTKELKAKIAPIFQTREIPQEIASQTQTLVATIKSAPYFEEYDEFKTYTLNNSGLKEDEYLKALRILLTNANDSVDLALVYKYLKNYLGEIIK